MTSCGDPQSSVRQLKLCPSDQGSLPPALVSATRAGVLCSETSAAECSSKMKDLPSPQPVAAGSVVPQSPPPAPPPPPDLAPYPPSPPDPASRS